MAPLFHQSFDGFSNHYFVQITYHILNRQMAFLCCVSLNVFSIDQFAKMPCHACNKKMAYLLYGSLHAFQFLAWLCVYDLSQIEQVNDFPPLWTFSCVVKEWSRTNYFSQLGQGKGFSPVWILSCLFNVWKWNVTFGASKWPLSCVSHVMFLKLTFVFKRLVTFGKSKHLPPSVNPFRNRHSVFPQRSDKCKIAHEKD